MAIAVTGGGGEVSRVGKFRVKDDLSTEAITDAPIDDKEYLRENSVWIAKRGVAVYVSAIEPTDAELNDIWIQP